MDPLGNDNINQKLSVLLGFLSRLGFIAEEMQGTIVVTEQRTTWSLKGYIDLNKDITKNNTRGSGFLGHILPYFNYHPTATMQTNHPEVSINLRKCSQISLC